MSGHLSSRISGLFTKSSRPIPITNRSQQAADHLKPMTPNHLYRWLIEPYQFLASAQDKRRAQLLAGLLLVLIPCTMSGAIASYPDRWATSYLLWGITAVMLLAYALSRTAYYNLGAILALGALNFSSFGAILVSPNETYTPEKLGLIFVWVVIPLVLGQIFFSSRGFIRLVSLNLVGLIALTRLPSLSDTAVLAPIGIILSVAVVLLVATSYRDAVERDRLAELQARQEALTAVNQQLTSQEQALRQYTTELESQNAELDAFSHTVAHDLKNPLVALMAIGNMIELLGPHPNPEKLNYYIHRIERNTDKMAKIIDELLLLAHVRKTDHIDTHPIDTPAILTAVIERLGDLIQDNHAQIILPSDPWPTAWGHAPWVEQIWVNYLSNAIKYSGVPPVITLGAETLPANRVRFWVQDNGEGLSAAQQAQLFTEFSRLHQVRADGHGLGLSIVQRIAQKLGGEVGVQSAPGQGCRFFFDLPATHP